jgi:hypothetical protein
MYATFNPHARFELRLPAGRKRDWPAMDIGWRKWRPTNPTSPWWYSLDRFSSLIAALLTEERAGGKALSVRQFIGSFARLSGVMKQKEVFCDADLPGNALADLVHDGAVDESLAYSLLDAMQRESKAIQPAALGVLGKDQIVQALVGLYGVAETSIRYRKRVGDADGLPYVLEVAFGVKEEGREQERCSRVAGLNFAPALTSLFDMVDVFIGMLRIDPHDPVVLLTHLTIPKIVTTDRGKARVVLPEEVDESLRELLTIVTREHTKAKRKADRHESRLEKEDLRRLRHEEGKDKDLLKRTCYEVLPWAYQEVSGNGSLPAEARQIMYKVRKVVLAKIGRFYDDKSQTFQQKILPAFLREHPELCKDWDVTFDSRGHFQEPHTGKRIGIGTIAVRSYIASWKDEPPPSEWKPRKYRCKTSGPAFRFNHALFLEKEGFGPLLRKAEIEERFDIAIMSTKGMSVTAARDLIVDLTEAGVTIHVMHDCDKTGFSILHTLFNDTVRYQFGSTVNVVDLGLRLEDALAMGLEGETVDYEMKKDPKIRLRECGATEQECQFLVSEQVSEKLWRGRRVELNEMSSPMFIHYLENKLIQHGVKKLVPDQDTLAEAYLQAHKLNRINAVVAEFLKSDDVKVEVPDNLEEQVRQMIEGTNLSWDQAIWRIVSGEEDDKAEKDS